MSRLESEEQQLDAVDGFGFGTFAYRRLSEENHHLLSVQNAPFETLLQGLGQVIPSA